AGRELVEQAGLHLDRSILVTGQLFEFGDQFTVWVEAAQIREIGPPGLRQQIGINGVRFGSRGRSMPIHGARIHWIDRPPSLQQEADQQAVCRLNDAGHVFLPSFPGLLLQIGMQTLQTFGGMGHPDRAQLTTLLINGQGVMMVISPVYSTKFHGFAPFLEGTWLLNCCVLILCRSKRDSLMTSPVQKPIRGRTSFLKRSRRVDVLAFPRLVRPSSTASISLAPAPCRGGLVLV